MKPIKTNALPVVFAAWFAQATADKKKGAHKVYGVNDRFCLVKFVESYFDGIQNREKRYSHWVVVEWVQQKNLNTFHYKNVGYLSPIEKFTINKNFGIELK